MIETMWSPAVYGLARLWHGRKLVIARAAALAAVFWAGYLFSLLV